MGREIRKVPPNWEHPKGLRTYSGGWRKDYIPLYDRDYDAVAREWAENCVLWSRGEHPDQLDGSGAEYKYYWEWAGGHPEKEDYVPYDSDDKDLCTWWQAYETVSEGTPVSPPFATADELIDYLSTHGDFWEQRRAAEQGRPVRPSSRETVARFVEMGHAFSMATVHTPGQPVKVFENIETVNIGDS